MPDARFSILVTGQISRAGLEAVARPESVSVDLVPFIATRPLPAAQWLDGVPAIPAENIHAIFTSGEAVRAVRHAMEPPRHWTFYCTSGGTENLLQDWLGSEAKIMDAPDADALAEIMTGSGLKDAVLFCGSLRRDQLPERARAAGIRLKEVVVYETTLTPVRLEKTYDAVLFFSPSAVNSFFSLNALPERTALFVIGKTTREELSKRLSVNVITAPQPDKILLLKKAVEYAVANISI